MDLADKMYQEPDERLKNAGKHHEGERIVNDYLEVGCLLNETGRDFLIRALDFQKNTTDVVGQPPCFTVNERLVCIVDDASIGECWLFYPKKMRIIKRFFRISEIA